MQLCKKQKTLFDFFAPFLKATSIFAHFKKKMIPISYVFSKLRATKDVVRKMSKTPRFRIPFDSQHAKG